MAVRHSPTLDFLTSSSLLEPELIEGCRRGDARSQEKLFRHFYGFVMGICLRYASSRQQAQEMLNDSFLKVFEKIIETTDIQVFRAWLRRIAVNTALDHYRKEKRRTERLETGVDETDLAVNGDVIDRMSAEDIIALLQEIPETYRLVFNLYEIEGYSHQEIGQMLSLPAATSRTYLTRAKQRMQWLLRQRNT